MPLTFCVPRHRSDAVHENVQSGSVIRASLLVYLHIKATWLELIRHDLKAISIILDYNNPNHTFEQLSQMAHDRYYWHNID